MMIVQNDKIIACAHTDGFHYQRTKIDGVDCRIRVCQDCGAVKDEKPEVIVDRIRVDLRPPLGKCQRLP